jgi:hypothetical protein
VLLNPENIYYTFSSLRNLKMGDQPTQYLQLFFCKAKTTYFFFSRSLSHFVIPTAHAENCLQTSVRAAGAELLNQIASLSGIVASQAN